MDSNSPDNILGRNVTRLRVIRGMDLAELAQRWRTTEAYVEGVEVGRIKPSQHMLGRLGRILNVEVGELISPSVEEIAKRCEELQGDWTAGEERERRTGDSRPKPYALPVVAEKCLFPARKN